MPSRDPAECPFESARGPRRVSATRPDVSHRVGLPRDLDTGKVGGVSLGLPKDAEANPAELHLRQALRLRCTQDGQDASRLKS